ncbi:MAG: hypothetical protein KGJ62_04115 [Armatimonadetes bacterium]|nr:hypothetical protein [Armatimonadota bacterium]MDE2205667.1 hypothetical protein [Armatimonadota bacterium]
MPTAVCFDVEDIISPAANDAELWMASDLADSGLTGTMLVMGESARLWERRGRLDVIEAMKRHDTGYHSTWHSVHPVTAEICLETDFREGMDALWAWDGDGWQDTERIMQRPLLGWGRTGSSWAPSIQGLMARLGRAYIYSPVRLPGHNVCWYAGCLGFHDDGIRAFDWALADDAAFAGHLAAQTARLRAHLGEQRSGARWLCWFMGHPTRAVHSDFWDADNFSAGANPPRSQWKAPPVLGEDQIATARRNYLRLCRMLADDDRLEIVGWSELIRRYSGQAAGATQQELLQAAQCVIDAGRPVLTDRFSAGELLVMFCRAVTHPSACYARPEVLGPLTIPQSIGSIANRAEAAAAAERLFRSLQPVSAPRCPHPGAPYNPDTGSPMILPSEITTANGSVGIDSLMVSLAHLLLGRFEAGLTSSAPWPAEADDIARYVGEEVPGWIIHPPQMDLSRVLEQTRLQCWALKPAWDRADLVVPQDGGGLVR